MRYRELGKTGLLVSEIGFGGEWMERHTEKEVAAVIARCETHGINILDCFMSEPNVRTNIGKALRGRRDRWVIQGHIGAVWQDNQYMRTRDMQKTKAAFEDLLTRLGIETLDIGMIHYIDDPLELETVMSGEYFFFHSQQIRQRNLTPYVRNINFDHNDPTRPFK